MKWARDASADGYDFRPRGGLDRSKSVDYLMNSVLNGKLLLPYMRTVDLPHGGTTEQPATSDVVRFDFVPQLLMLLQPLRTLVQQSKQIYRSTPSLSQAHTTQFAIPCGILLALTMNYLARRSSDQNQFGS